ncbi:DUF6225 family protein [Krasilnikovia sp. MM14-A1259]|uniref:DUF6225 family protein n=1 Tax=Krasilnikovia sp. MM14-A1259 TaxID=3373539 RepID=UPI0037F23367
MLTPEQHAALKIQLVDVFGAAAAQILQVRDRGDVAALRSGAEAKRAHLADVAAAMAAAAIAEDWAKTEAAAAAQLGASYTELGAAAGITRQGARSRWPGLAELAAAARRAGRPPAPESTQREVGRAPTGGRDEEVEIEFEHTVTAWTVGDLRTALLPPPADMPVWAITAEEPGGEVEGETQIVKGTFLSASPVVADEGKNRLVLLLDFPTGTYQRRIRGPFGRSSRGDEFQHEAEPITVAALLAALEDLAADMPVLAWLADEPGSDHGDQQIVFDGAIGVDWSPPVRGERDGEWVPGNHFDLQLEFATGRYSRYVHR